VPKLEKPNNPIIADPPGSAAKPDEKTQLAYWIERMFRDQEW
jgi:hypothetical protein